VSDQLHQKDDRDSEHGADGRQMLDGYILYQLEPLGAKSPRRENPDDERDMNSDHCADTAIGTEECLHGACLVRRDGADFTNRTYRSIALVLRLKRYPV